MIETAPVELSAIAFIAAAALAAVAGLHALRVWNREHRVYVGDILWTLPFISLLVLEGAFCLNSLVSSDMDALHTTLYSIVLFGCGSLTQLRRYARRALDSLPFPASEPLRAFIALAALAAVSITSAWMVDFAWLESSGSIQVQYVGVSALIFAAVGVALYFLGQRSGTFMALVPIAAAGFGTAQHFVMEFKGMPIMPTDLLALETAGAVAGGYEYVLTSEIVISLCATGVCLCLLSFVSPRKPNCKSSRFMNMAVNTAAGVAVVLGLSGLYGSVKLEEAINFPYDRWMPVATYQALGFVPAFIEVAQDLAIPIPDAYDERDAEALISRLASQFDADMGAAGERKAAEAQFAELKPTVIAVMNETFTDMSIYDEIRAAGYGGPQRYKSLAGTLQRGALMVPALGGGTANTEFEFLTGNTMAFIGSGKYPYQLYDLHEIDSLAMQFDELGYRTIALHPQNPVNWKRSTAYEQMGFDEFLSLDDFEGLPWYHSGVTDAATYDRIIELLERDASPQFIFDVTMQNHSGYPLGSVPAEDEVHLDVPGVADQGVLDELGVYLACIERSDQDFAYFIERLRQVNRPVVLVFFGDHQPGLSTTLDEILYADGDPQAREFRKYESTYLVWANYEIAGNAALDVIQETSSAQLAARVLYQIGAPLTDRQKADLVLGKSISSVNITGYRASDGNRYALDSEGSYREALNQMQAIQYLEFGSKVQ